MLHPHPHAQSFAYMYKHMQVAAAAGLLNPARASAQGRRWNTSPQVFSRCARRVQCWNFWWFDEQRELFGAGVVPSCVAAGLNCEGPIEALGRIMVSCSIWLLYVCVVAASSAAEACLAVSTLTSIPAHVSSTHNQQHSLQVHFDLLISTTHNRFLYMHVCPHCRATCAARLVRPT